MRTKPCHLPPMRRRFDVDFAAGAGMASGSNAPNNGLCSPPLCFVVHLAELFFLCSLAGHDENRSRPSRHSSPPRARLGARRHHGAEGTDAPGGRARIGFDDCAPAGRRRANARSESVGVGAVTCALSSTTLRSLGIREGQRSPPRPSSPNCYGPNWKGSRFFRKWATSATALPTSFRAASRSGRVAVEYGVVRPIAQSRPPAFCCFHMYG